MLVKSTAKRFANEKLSVVFRNGVTFDVVSHVVVPLLGHHLVRAALPVVVNDERDCFEENTVLGVRVLNLFRLGRLLGLVQDGLQAFVESSANTRILGWRVVLQQTQQLD